MITFTDHLWGYRLTYPNDWVEQRSNEIQAFAAVPEALNQNYTGPQAGYLLVRGEFNHTAESIDPLWSSHITKISMMVGAKNLGSAPFAVEGGTGYEAEIVLPKTKNKRLWTGILSYGLAILHLMVEHPLDQRVFFEPLVTGIIASLRFIHHLPNLTTTERNIPLPPVFENINPKSILSDIDDHQEWEAYAVEDTTGSLQAFYTRELPHYGWEISDFTPYPNQSEIQLARFHLTKGEENAVLGILPKPREDIASGIVIRYLIS
jgi:hypothetical protein